MLNFGPLPVIGWDNSCSQCLHPHWLCQHLIRHYFKCFATACYNGLSYQLKFNWELLVHDPNIISWHTCEYCSWWHSQASCGLAIRTRTLIWPSLQLGISPGNKDAWTDVIIFSQILVDFLVSYTAIWHFLSKFPLQKIKRAIMIVCTFTI